MTFNQATAADLNTNIVVGATGEATTFANVAVSKDLNLAVANAAFNVFATNTDLSANVTTDAVQSYSGGVTVNGDSILKSNAVAAANGGIKLTGAVTGTKALTVNTLGTTTFGNTVSGLTALTTKPPGGSSTIISGNVTTTAGQTYGDSVQLATDVTFDAGAGSVNINGGLVDTTGKNVTFTSPVGLPASPATIAAGAGKYADLQRRGH